MKNNSYIVVSNLYYILKVNMTRPRHPKNTIYKNRDSHKLGFNLKKRKAEDSGSNTIHKRLKVEYIGILQTAILVSHLNSIRYFIPILDSEEEIECVPRKTYKPEYNLALLANVCVPNVCMDEEENNDDDDNNDEELAKIFGKLCS